MADDHTPTTSPQDDNNAGSAGGAQPAERVSTTNRKWAIKILIFAAVLIGFGLWGLYDAKVVYPRRGYRASEDFELRYLESLRTGGMIESRRASVENPKEELASLEEKAKSNPLSASQAALKDWLGSLALVGKLAPENTTIPRTDFFRGDRIETADQRVQALAKIEGSGKPLDNWDIPTQWLIFFIGVALGMWTAGLVLVVSRRRYRWEPQSQRLTLPTGETLVPGDIDEFDKRKWDKFIIFLKVKSTHPTLGGKEVSIDLLRHVPVEEWVLTMEKTAFPETSETEKAAVPQT